MPILHQRIDGSFFIRNHYDEDHHTLQVRAEGVRFLERRGVTRDTFFATPLLMELFDRGWIFTATCRPRVAATSSVGGELEASVREFHVALKNRDERRLSSLVLQLNERVAVRDLPELKSWRLVDAVVAPVGAPASAIARVTLHLKFDSPQTVEQIWVNVGEWKLVVKTLQRGAGAPIQLSA